MVTRWPLAAAEGWIKGWGREGPRDVIVPSLKCTVDWTSDQRKIELNALSTGFGSIWSCLTEVSPCYLLSLCSRGNHFYGARLNVHGKWWWFCDIAAMNVVFGSAFLCHGYFWALVHCGFCESLLNGETRANIRAVSKCRYRISAVNHNPTASTISGIPPLPINQSWCLSSLGFFCVPGSS